MNAPQALGHPYPWPAPGKLNLFLHIVGRRSDGYHLLQTAFQFIDLCDELSFWQRADGVIERVGEVAGVPAGADLALRAARVLAAQHRVRAGVGIELRKRLPVQGGVGGGSSDAATVLVALNRLWRLDLSVEALAALGLGLGADVPVFVRGQAAWAEGVGEQLTPADFPAPIYVLVQPDVTVTTAELFQATELTRDSPDNHNDRFSDDGWAKRLRAGGPAAVSGGGRGARLARAGRTGAADRYGVVRIRGDAG